MSFILVYAIMVPREVCFIRNTGIEISQYNLIRLFKILVQKFYKNSYLIFYWTEKDLYTFFFSYFIEYTKKINAMDSFLSSHCINSICF